MESQRKMKQKKYRFTLTKSLVGYIDMLQIQVYTTVWGYAESILTNQNDRFTKRCPQIRLDQFYWIDFNNTEVN